MPYAVTPSPLPDDEPAARAQLRRLAAGLARFALAAALALAAFAGAVLVLGLTGGDLLWLAPGTAYLGAAPEGVLGLVPFGALPLLTWLAYAVKFILAQGPLVLVLAELYRLLRGFADDATFAAVQAGRLNRIALWLAASALAPSLGEVLVSVAGHGVDRAWFHPASVYALLFAALLGILAALLRVGAAIERDRDGVV